MPSDLHLPAWLPAAWTSLHAALPEDMAESLPLMAGAALLVGMLVILLAWLPRRATAPALPDQPVAPPVEPAVPDPALQQRIAALETELAAAREAALRQQQDADAGVQSFCAILAPALSTLAEAAERGRTAAAECAAQADAVNAAMRDAAEDASRTAATLAALGAHTDSLALSVQAIAAALGSVAKALDADRDAGAGAGSGDGTAVTGHSVVQLAGQAASALTELVTSLHVTAQAANAIAARIGAVRDAAEAGSAAAQAMAHATDAVGRNAIAVGLEFATFLDSLSRAGNRRKFDRYPTDLAATIVVDGKAHRARIVDVSRGGCAMDGDPGLATGTRVMLHLPGVEEALEARVARRLGSITGLEFAEPDPLAGRLEALIVACREAA